MALTQLKTGAIADDAVTTDKLANAINTERTANTAKVSLDADAVTGAKIADDAVGAEHIEQLDADLSFADSAKAKFGAGNDLEIYHDGSGSAILNAAGSGQLTISSDNALNLTSRTGQEYFFRGYTNGAAELYHDNSKKLETISTGLNVTGGVRLGGNNSANELDDYEQGTFTPVLFGQTGSTNTTGRSTAYGHYTKIGPIVSISFFVEANTGTATGQIKVAGLPFAPSSDPSHQWCGSYNWYSPGGSQSGSNFSHWVNSILYLTSGDTNIKLVYAESASMDSSKRSANWASVGTDATYGYFRCSHNFQYYTDA